MNIEKRLLTLRSLKAKKSKFWEATDEWQNFFSSRSYEIEDIQNFLSPSANSATGIGVHNISNSQQFKHFEKLAKITLRSCPNILSFLKKVYSENLFGEKCFNYKDLFFMSRSTLMNAHSCHLILDQLGKQSKLGILKGNIKVNILEIGSGFGELARLLVKFGEAKNCHFHLVDLPENLFFAELYLGRIFGSNSIVKSIFNKKELANSNSEECKFSFYLPSELDTSPIQNVDISINTYSLQEMTPSTAKAYVSYISRNLNKEGLFFSINAPNKWDIKKYSDYNFHTLKCINSVTHRLLNPASFEASTPIFNTFKTRDLQDKILDNDDILKMNKIGILQNFGLGRLLELISEEKLSITDPIKSINIYFDKKEKNLKTAIEHLFYLASENEDSCTNKAILKTIAKSPYYYYFSDSLILKLEHNLRLNGEIKTYCAFISHYYGIQKKPQKFISRLVLIAIRKLRKTNLF